MSFFSVEFLIVFTVFFVIYNYLNTSFQNILLMLFNIIFIVLLSPYFLLIVFLTAFFVHYFALSIYVRKSDFYIKAALSFCILNLSLFKYFVSIKENFEDVFSYFGFNNFELFFPLGISFYTFNAISYLLYIYKEDKKPVEFYIVFTYLSFFATFMSGPIFRFNNFYRQYIRLKRFRHLESILVLILFSLVKIFLILPFLNTQFNSMLDNYLNSSILGLFNIFFIYSLKLYCDFSAYVNIVSALALIIGFKLPKNFNNPFRARNIQDFWRRWHISLSNYIKDYVYIPLGGSWCSKIINIRNIIIAFALSGIWHGNTLNFLFWGLLHAFALVFLLFFTFKLNRFIASFFTFIYVSFAWIFFHFQDYSDSFDYISHFNNFNISYDEIIVFLLIFIYFCFNYVVKNMLVISVLFFKHINLFFKIVVTNIILFIVFTFMPGGIPEFLYASF